jgi:hypothetical protein
LRPREDPWADGLPRPGAARSLRRILKMVAANDIIQSGRHLAPGDPSVVRYREEPAVG